MAKYAPPVQGKLSQFLDVVVLMVLAIGALYIPLWLGLAGASKTPNPVENPTWEGLGQTPLMVERWNALGYADAAAAQDMITARFDYGFTWVGLAVMAIVVVGYFVMMLRLSTAEYREVIAEKFDGK